MGKCNRGQEIIQLRDGERIDMDMTEVEEEDAVDMA